MNKICTSIEQSKKLVELGLDVNTADMFWDLLDGDEPDEKIPNCCWDRFDITINEFVPAWSLSALLELNPFQIIENNNRFTFYQVKGLNKQGETYRFGYKTNNNSFLFETSWHNDVIDATFEIICWLKENNKI